MKIEINLDDPQECFGCPLLKKDESFDGGSCQLYNWKHITRDEAWATLNKGTRPDYCIKENGK